MASSDNALSLVLGASGQILSYAVGKDARQDYVRKQLVEIRDLCLRSGQSFPEQIAFDDCCSNSKMVAEVFEGHGDAADDNVSTDPFCRSSVVVPPEKIFRGIPHCNCDIKHIVNRLAECLRKTSPLYCKFSKELHGAVSGSSTVPIRGRDGNLYEVSAPLNDPDHIWANILRQVQVYKNLEAAQSTGLFTNDFDTTLKNQEKHVKNCMREIFDRNGSHCYEVENGSFKLHRGTNRNESCHRRLNSMWPDKMGEALFEALLVAFVFNWNMKRCNYSDEEADGKVMASVDRYACCLYLCAAAVCFLSYYELLSFL